MNPKKQNVKSRTATHPVLKKILIALLVIFSMGGYAGTAFLIFRSGATVQSVVTQGTLYSTPQQQNTKDPSLLDSLLPGRWGRPAETPFEGVRDLFRSAGEEKGERISFTFQGTLAGTDSAIAMINDKPVAVGSDVQGVHVASISNRVLILEYKGQTRKLVVGETVSLQLD